MPKKTPKIPSFPTQKIDTGNPFFWGGYMVKFGSLGIKFSSGPRWFGTGNEPREA